MMTRNFGFFNVGGRGFSDLAKGATGSRVCLHCQEKFPSQKALDKHLRASGQPPADDVNSEGSGQAVAKMDEVGISAGVQESDLQDLVDDLNWILAEEQCGQAPPPAIAKAAQAVVDYVRDIADKQTADASANDVVKSAADEARAELESAVCEMYDLDPDADAMTVEALTVAAVRDGLQKSGNIQSALGNAVQKGMTR